MECVPILMMWETDLFSIKKKSGETCAYGAALYPGDLPLITLYNPPEIIF